MSTRIFSGHELGQALLKEGLIPPECAVIELHLPVDSTFQIHYVVNVREEDIPKLVRAIASLAPAPDDPLRVACQALLSAPHDDHFAARLNDAEMAALNTIKQLVTDNDDDSYTPSLSDA